MKKSLLTLSLLFAGLIMRSQVGMSCQYFPGAQFGFVSVKATNNPGFTKYKYGAGLPVLLIDRLSNHWYTNIDMSAVYYGATQTNKANDNRLKISKAEGAVCAGRLGYLFGDGDQFRFGGNLNLGYSTSNIDSFTRPMKQIGRAYWNYGIGIIAYQKFGKFRVVGKLGYELYAQKKYISKAHGMYFEGTIGYSFYQKFGVSVMPCFYSKKFSYTPLTPEGGTPQTTLADAKVKSFVLRVGLSRFF